MSAYLSLIRRRRGGRLFEAGRLLTFAAFRMGAYSRWALIRGWVLIRISTVTAIKEDRKDSLVPNPLIYNSENKGRLLSTVRLSHLLKTSERSYGRIPR